MACSNCTNCTKCVRARLLLESLRKGNHLQAKATDVVLGRGRKIEGRRGNQAFVQLTSEFLDAYQRATGRKDKKAVTVQVVKTAKSMGIRFLRQNAVKMYEEASDETVRVRVGQSLRYMMKNKRGRSEAGSSSVSVASADTGASQSVQTDSEIPQTSMDTESTDMECADHEPIPFSQIQLSQIPTQLHFINLGRPASPTGTESMALSDSDLETVAASLVDDLDNDVTEPLLNFPEFTWEVDIPEEPTRRGSMQ